MQHYMTMEISEKLQALYDKAEDAFMAAERAQSAFVRAAEAEGWSERDIRAYWSCIVDWGTKEQNAKLWMTTILAEPDDSVEDVVEDIDKFIEEIRSAPHPDDLLKWAEGLMVEFDRRFQEMLTCYSTILSNQGMAPNDIIRSAAKALGRELPDHQADDPLDADILD